MRRMTCCPWLASFVLASGLGALLPGQELVFGPSPWKGREPRRELRPLALEAQGRLPRASVIPGPLSGDVFIGGANGMRLHTLSAAARARSPGLRISGDGGGADVSGLFLIQDRFLDSQCGFPPECGGPCNVVVMAWEETTENTAGVNVLVDGQLLGTAPGIPAAELPGIHVAFVSGVPPGLHVFRIEDAAGTTSDEAGIMVLDGQPFKDVSDLMCAQGGAGDGTCEVLADWDNEGPFPAEIGVVFDGEFLGTRPGVSFGVAIPDATPGEHCVQVFGIAPFGEGSDAIYRGCFLETCCTVTCERPDCQPPLAPLVCQVNYGTNDADNIVLVGWANGEATYAGVNILVDDAPRETLAGDDEITALNMLSAGPHKFGIQGDCGPANGLSTITEVTFPVLSASPHPSPITGAGVTCEFTPDPDGDGPELSDTTATWAPDDPSNFIDVYVIRDTLIAYIATLPGNATGVEVTDTLEGDIISLQFFATIDGNCYGSPFFQCAPTVPTGNRYMQGLCNGTGASPQITSAVFFLNYLFVGGGVEPPCLKACDSNGDGSGNLTDAVYVLSYLFSGGPAPTLWVDSDDDGAEDPTCTVAAPEDDCEASHEVCG